MLALSSVFFGSLCSFVNCQVSAAPVSDSRGKVFQSKFKQSQVHEPKGRVDAIELDQIHRYFGKVQLIVAKEGLRMNSKEQHFAVVAKPPTWNLVAYRDDEKSMFEENFDSFLDRGMMSSLFMSYHNDYILTEAPARHFKFGGVNAIRKTSRAGETFNYIANDGRFDKKEILLIHAIYKTPTNGGIPLLFAMIAHGNEASSGRSVEGNQLVYLSTSGIKSVKIDANSFDTPVGYKRVKFVGDVTFSKLSHNEAKDFNNLLEH